MKGTENSGEKTKDKKKTPFPVSSTHLRFLQERPYFLARKKIERKVFKITLNLLVLSHQITEREKNFFSFFVEPLVFKCTLISKPTIYQNKNNKKKYIKFKWKGDTDGIFFFFL